MFEAQVTARGASLLSLLVIGLAAAGCAPGRYAVRLRTADGQVQTTTARPRPSLALEDEQVQKAVQVVAREVVPAADPLAVCRQKFEVPIRGGSYFFNQRTKQLTPLDDATAASEFLLPELLEQTRRYLQWCEIRRQPGDCLRVLGHRRILDQHGRYAVAMAIAISGTLESTKDSLKEMADPVAVTAMVVGGITMYAVLWVLPEPVSKGIAAGMTLVLVAYFGVETLYTLGSGWKTLIERADAATTFDELRVAGEDFADVMGANNAGILVMVATAAVGSGANAGKNALAKLAPKLPGAPQASRLAVAEGSVPLDMLGQVETVTISESGLAIALANAPDATMALAPVATLGTSLMAHGLPGGSGNRPSREERLAELSKDPDQGGRIDAKRLREAEVALDMEEQGRLKGPVRRPARGDGHSGDFVDGKGQDWDVKQPHSRAQLEENLRQKAIADGDPPPKFDPGRPIRGEFDLQKTLASIDDQFRSGKHVIIDTSKLNPADLDILRQALVERGLLGAKVLMYP